MAKREQARESVTPEVDTSTPSQHAILDMFEPGLWVVGTVVGRTRRLVGERNLPLVTYRVACGDNVHDIQHWDPAPDAILERNSEVSLRVEIRVREGRVNLRIPDSNGEF